MAAVCCDFLFFINFMKTKTNFKKKKTSFDYNHINELNNHYGYVSLQNYVPKSGTFSVFFGSCLKLKALNLLKFVSSGKNFTIPDTSSADDGLYSACQTTNVQLFGMSVSASESQLQFDETLEQMMEFYKHLDRTFRVTYVTGDKLTQAEELRANFEMYSPHRKCFVPIGHLSSYGNYISKRLLIAVKDDNEKQYQFPHIISGSVINVTKFVAILLEEKGVFRTPTILENLK